MRLHLRPCALARPYRSCHNLALLATPRRAPAAAGSLVKNIKPPELLDRPRGTSYHSTGHSCWTIQGSELLDDNSWIRRRSSVDANPR